MEEKIRGRDDRESRERHRRIEEKKRRRMWLALNFQGS
jgi:hypothetical protein